MGGKIVLIHAVPGLEPGLGILLIVRGINGLRPVPDTADAGGDELGVVMLPDFLCQDPGPLGAVGTAVPFRHLIADGIAENTGMVPVPAHHTGNVPGIPVGKPQVVIPRSHFAVPHIEGFVHEDDTQSVAGFQHRQRGRIVGAADGIKTGLFQQPQFPVHRRREIRRPQNTVVMVDAATPQLDGFAVEQQAVPGIGGNGPDAEGIVRRIGYFAVQGNFRMEGVQIGGIHRPQRGIGNLQKDLRLGLLPRHHCHGDGLADSGRGGSDYNFPVQIRADLIRNGYHRPIIFNRHRIDKHIPGLHPNFATGPKAHIPVQTGTGIPAGGGLVIVGVDFQLIGPAWANFVGQLHEIWRIAMGMQANKLIVQLHFRTHICAVHIQDHMGRFLKFHILDIPGKATPEESVGRAAGGVDIPGLTDGIVIGDIHRLPVTAPRSFQQPVF